MQHDPVPNLRAARAALLPTQSFRRQHEELFHLAETIEAKLEVVRAGGPAAEVRRLLAQYSGKLGVHLRIEDEVLYPRLLEEKDQTLQRAAAALQEEVGALDEEFQAFLRAWPSAASIESRPIDFARRFGRIVRCIRRRMQREEAELYPLLDALE